MGACLSKRQEVGASTKADTGVSRPGEQESPVEKESAVKPAPEDKAVLVEAGKSQGQPSEPGPQNETVSVAAALPEEAGSPAIGSKKDTLLAQQIASPFASHAAQPGVQEAPTKSTDGSGVVEINGVSNAASSLEWRDDMQFKGPPQLDPASERVRVHALKRLGVDFTSTEPSLDFITKLVTNVCNFPAATMTFIDSTRCHIKSAVGTDIKSLDRRLSLSTWVLAPLNPEVMVVEDLSVDNRFKHHPWIAGPPHVRFFAGAPLLDASGQRVGSLSVHDYKPRKLDAESCNVLCNFAEMLMREVQRLSEAGMSRTMSLNPTPENEQLLRSIDACSDGVVLLDVRLVRWPVLFSNEGWTRVTGLSPVSGSLKCFWDMFRLPGVSSSSHPWELYDEAVERGETFQLDVVLAGSSGKQLLPVTFKPATEALDEGMVSIKVPAQQASPQTSPSSTRLFYFGTIFSGSKLEHSTLSSVASLRQTNSSLRQTGSLPGEDANQPPIPGVKLGPLLGKGSFGSVHYGTWNGAQIAVKVIQHMATEAERQARDEQLEAILGLKMLHPNIVRTFQFATKDRSGSRPATLSERLRMEMNGMPSEEPSTPSGARRMMETWIVLELCNRGSLQEAIDKGAFRVKGAPNEAAPNMLNIMRTAIEIAGAMMYLHSLDILHSDLNGNNILLISNTGIDDRPFSVKVSDFGLSRIHIGEKTVATQTYGTVTHMPPELLAEGRLSKAADVYAFGVLLWEMYTSQRPWAGLRHVQIITRKMKGGNQLKWPPTVFPAFKDVAQVCMNPDPHHRPTFAEVLEMLEPIRQQAERGELQRAGSLGCNPPDDAQGKSMGALLGSVKRITEEEEDQQQQKNKQ